MPKLLCYLIFIGSLITTTIAHANLLKSLTPSKQKNNTVPTELQSAQHIGNCGNQATLISSIQGTGLEVTQKDVLVVIEGIVTVLRDKGFFIQEEPKDSDKDALSSEGIFVFTHKMDHALKVGDRARVFGTTAEHYNNSQIKAQSIKSCGLSDVTLKPIVIDLYHINAQVLEPVEGMLVSVSDALISNTNNLLRYGEIEISETLKRIPSDVAIPLSDSYYAHKSLNDADKLLIEDNNTKKNPNMVSFFPQLSYQNSLTLGDKVSVVGALNYAYDSFRINPIKAIQHTPQGRDVNTDLLHADVTIATFNVLNYFNGQAYDDGSTTYQFKKNRGAKSFTEFKLQQSRLVAALLKMDADVVALTEVENDGFKQNSAIRDLVTALNRQQEKSKRYRWIASKDKSPIGSDAITNGIIYRPSVVEPEEGLLVIDMPSQRFNAIKTRDSQYTLDMQAEGKRVTIVKSMRPTLVQKFQYKNGNDSFALAVNHFKSKSSPCYEDLLPKHLQEPQNLAQGYCNALRVSAAVHLGEVLQASHLPEKILIVGDLNSYSQEDPIALLTQYDTKKRSYPITEAMHTSRTSEKTQAAQTYGYHLANNKSDPDNFSYAYKGQLGSLDHILVSPATLSAIVDVDHWNINATELRDLETRRLFKYYKSNTHYAKYYAIDAYRCSDHDPVLISLKMQSSEQ